MDLRWRRFRSTRERESFEVEKVSRKFVFFSVQVLEISTKFVWITHEVTYHVVSSKFPDSCGILPRWNFVIRDVQSSGGRRDSGLPGLSYRCGCNLGPATEFGKALLSVFRGGNTKAIWTNCHGGSWETDVGCSAEKNFYFNKFRSSSLLCLKLPPAFESIGFVRERMSYEFILLFALKKITNSKK